MGNKTINNNSADGRIMPQACDVEKAVLGSLLVGEDYVLDDIVSKINGRMFYDERNGLIFNAIRNLLKKQKPVDILTTTDELNSMGILDKAGGTYYLAEISESAILGQRIDEHINIIRTKYMLREQIRLFSRSLDLAYQVTTDPADILADVQRNLSEMDDLFTYEDTSISSAISELNDVVRRNRSGNTPTAFPTGFMQIDRNTGGGFHPGELNIVAAESSQGKTSFTLALLQSMARNCPCVVYSTEMSRLEICAKLESMNTQNLSANTIMNRWMSDIQMEQYYKGANIVRELHIDVDESFNNIESILASMRRFIRKVDAKVFIVDYLQNLSRKGVRNLADYFEEVCTELKNFARSNQVCIILLSQLNRDRDNKTPSIDRLKGSSGIGQAADFIFHIMRPEAMIGSGVAEYPEPFRHISIHGTAMISCSKGRFSGIVPPFICGFDGTRTLFYELDQAKLPLSDIMDDDPY